MNPIITGNLKSKTSWAAILLMALGGLEQSGLLALIPDAHKGIAISAVGALMLFLRNITSQPVTDKAVGQSPVNNQGGFARPLMLAILLAVTVPMVAVLPGCASLGLAPASSFEDRLAYAQGQTTGLRDASTRALDAKLITSEDMEYCINLADRSRDMLRLARLSHGQGDLSTAEGRLLLVSSILTELENYLTTRSASR